MIGNTPLPVYSTDLVVIVSMHRFRISGCGMIARLSSPSQVCSRSCLGGVRSPFLMRLLCQIAPRVYYLGAAPSEARPANLFKLLLILLYVEVRLSVRAAAHRDKKIKPFPQPRRAGVLGGSDYSESASESASSIAS